MWSDVAFIFQKYMGSGLTFIWFLAALIFLYLTEKRKERRIFFVYIPVIVLMIYFNPLFYRAFFFLLEKEIYFRICWMLPVTLVIAYAVVCLIERSSGGKQIVYVVLVVLLVMVTGKPVYTNPLYSRAENEYHVPQAIVEICDAVRVPGREVLVTVPPELVLYVRQYDPTVCLAYGRDYMSVDTALIREQMEAKNYNLEVLAPYVEAVHCHYIVLDEKKEIQGEPLDFGWRLMESTSGYSIYRIEDEPLIIP